MAAATSTNEKSGGPTEVIAAAYDISCGWARQISPLLQGYSVEGVYHVTLRAFDKEFVAWRNEIFEFPLAYTPLGFISDHTYSLGYTHLDKGYVHQAVRERQVSAEESHPFNPMSNTFIKNLAQLLTGNEVPVWDVPSGLQGTPLAVAITPLLQDIDRVFGLCLHSGMSTPVSSRQMLCSLIKPPRELTASRYNGSVFVAHCGAAATLINRYMQRKAKELSGDDVQLLDSLLNYLDSKVDCVETEGLKLVRKGICTGPDADIPTWLYLLRLLSLRKEASEYLCSEEASVLQAALRRAFNSGPTRCHILGLALATNMFSHPQSGALLMDDELSKLLLGVALPLLEEGTSSQRALVAGFLYNYCIWLSQHPKNDNDQQETVERIMAVMLDTLMRVAAVAEEARLSPSEVSALHRTLLTLAVLIKQGWVTPTADIMAKDARLHRMLLHWQLNVVLSENTHERELGRILAEFVVILHKRDEWSISQLDQQ